MGSMESQTKPLRSLSMKKWILLLLIFLPTLSNAQLSDDGKSFEPVSNNQNLIPRANTITFSFGNNNGLALLGIKYQ